MLVTDQKNPLAMSQDNYFPAPESPVTKATLEDIIDGLSDGVDWATNKALEILPKAALGAVMNTLGTDLVSSATGLGLPTLPIQQAIESLLKNSLKNNQIELRKDTKSLALYTIVDAVIGKLTQDVSFHHLLFDESFDSEKLFENLSPEHKDSIIQKYPRIFTEQ